MSEATVSSTDSERIALGTLPGAPSPSVAPTTLPPAKWSRGWLKLTPINRRRLDNFKRNRRGYWSLWIFMILFVVSLCAEFVANDKPILVLYKGEILVPVLHNYPEEKFGGFLADTDYFAPSIAAEVKAHGWMLWPPIRFSYNTQNYNMPKGLPGHPIGAPSPPTWTLTDEQCRTATALPGQTIRGCRDIEWNWLGTDGGTRDVVARVIYGFRTTVLFGLILVAISSVIGIAAGAVQGYFGGWTDLLFQRIIEIWSSLPQLYLLIILAYMFKPSFFTLLGILLLFSWVRLVPMVRAEFLRARNFEYVTAARALGLSNITIMSKHLLPNAMVATLTFMPFILSGSIETLTSLDFLGLGLPQESASLGELLRQGYDNTQAWWLGLTGFFVVAIMLSLLVFIGEAVRDAFDPRKTYY